MFYPTDHKAEDTDGTISFSKSPIKSQKETSKKDATRLALNNEFRKGDFVAVDEHENETSKTHKGEKLHSVIIIVVSSNEARPTSAFHWTSYTGVE